MARIIDQEKIENIKRSTLEHVVEKGYGGASVSSIARQAGVAEGYLYRFYKGKQELVADLLHQRVNKILEQIESSLSQCSGIHTAIEYLIDELFNMAQTSPIEIKFMHILMHDYNFQIADNQRERIKMLSEKIRTKGIETKEISDNVTIEEIFNMVVIYPIEFLNMRFKNFFGNSSWSQNDKERVIEFVIKSLKNA